MRQAKPDDVFSFVRLADIENLWRDLERYLGKSRAFWVWILGKWGVRVGAQGRPGRPAAARPGDARPTSNRAGPSWAVRRSPDSTSTTARRATSTCSGEAWRGSAGSDASANTGSGRMAWRPPCSRRAHVRPPPRRRRRDDDDPRPRRGPVVGDRCPRSVSGRRRDDRRVGRPRSPRRQVVCAPLTTRFETSSTCARSSASASTSIARSTMRRDATRGSPRSTSRGR